MRRIVDDRWPVKYPPYMSNEARDLIMRLLERKPAKRIGMLQGRAKDIKDHPWFQVRVLLCVHGLRVAVQYNTSVEGLNSNLKASQRVKGS